LHSAAVGGGFGGVPLAVRLRTLPRLLAGYLTLPLRFDALTVCDDAALSESWDAATLAGLALLIAVLGAAVALRRRVPAATFGIVWMLLLLLPVLNVVPILHYRADRFFYLPLLGWSIAVVAVAGTLPTPAVLRSPAVGWSGIVAALLALATLTALRNRVFSDDVALFEATLRVSPLCREAHTTLGDAYLHQGRADAAARQYEAALAPAPGRISYVVTPKVHINLGMAYLAQHRYADAEQHFAAAHREQPGLLHPLFGLGVATLAQGRPAEAADWLQRAAALAPGDPDVAFNLALAYDRLGRAADAATAYARFIAVAPPGHARTVAEQRLRVLRPNS